MMLHDLLMVCLHSQVKLGQGPDSTIHHILSLLLCLHVLGSLGQRLSHCAGSLVAVDASHLHHAAYFGGSQLQVSVTTFTALSTTALGAGMNAWMHSAGIHYIHCTV
jgi:hypothetical protein